jgi:hypothetical protein
VDQIGLWAGFILTLMVFSYILGDNILYRLAVYVFVGLTAGYVLIVTWDSVLTPWLNGTLLAANPNPNGIIVGLIPLVLGVLLLLKSSSRFSHISNLALAFIIAVGTAVALVGAIVGTMLPLSYATGAGLSLNPVNGLLVLLGVVCTLFYFQYLSRRTPGGDIRPALHVRVFGLVGQGVVVVTLGALYAAAILSSLTIFSERLSFLVARIGGG